MVSFMDRKSHAEARTLAFLCENSLPLCLTPHLIEYAKEMAHDSRVLVSVNMERTTANYKLREGLGVAYHEELVSDLKMTKFSINLDECFCAKNEKVLSILVAYFSENLKEVVVKHYASISLVTVNAQTLFDAIIDMFRNDEIPLDNLVSDLSDSTNYMRGKVNGFETKLRDAAPHLLDVDGDICHHVHNVVKKFTGFFGRKVEALLDDIHTDCKWSPDLRERLEKLCTICDVKFNNPKQRISHRWLSGLDCSLPVHNMFPALTVLYSAWLQKDDVGLYKDVVDEITDGLSINAKKVIRKMVEKRKLKSLTKAGRERKERIVESLFHFRQETLLHVNLYLEILPIFKSFILIFEQREPLVHRIYDEQVDLVKTLLACFIKPEFIKDITGRKLKGLDLKDKNMQRKLNEIYVGTKAEEILLRISHKNSEFKSDFLKNLFNAYVESCIYIINKFPLNNSLLRCLSAIDPKAQGYSVTQNILKKLPKFFPTVALDLGKYNIEIMKLQIDSNLPPACVENKAVRLDKWWSVIFDGGLYVELSKLIKACLSIFTSPHVEQSFSIMNNLINTKTNRLDIETYSAMATTRYQLISKKSRALTQFRRKDVLHDPVDKNVCFYLQTASGRYNRKLKQRRRQKDDTAESLNVSNKKHPKNVSFHQQSKNVKTAITGKIRSLKRKNVSNDGNCNKKKKQNN